MGGREALAWSESPWLTGVPGVTSIVSALNGDESNRRLPRAEVVFICQVSRLGLDHCLKQHECRPHQLLVAIAS